MVQGLPRPQRRQKRLWIVFFGAILLVTLPVLPLSFLGIPGPDLAEFNSNVGDVGKRLLGILSPRKVVKASSDGLNPSAKTRSDNIRLLDGAARSLLHQIEKDPANPSLSNQVGLIYAELGDYNQAERHFKRAIALCRVKISELENRQKSSETPREGGTEADMIVASSRMNVELSAAHTNLTRVFESLGQHDRALKQFDEMKRDIAFNIDLSKARARYGAVSAVESIPRAQRLDPDTAQALARAQALMHARRMPEAMTEFQKVIELNPDVAVAHQQLGIAAGMSGNYYMAEQELRAAARLNPEDAVTRTNLGITYASSGEIKKARREFERALKIDAGNLEASINLASILSATREYDEARQVLEKASARHPRSPLVLNNLATIYSLEGKYHQAIDAFQKTLSVDPSMASAHYGLGIAYYNSKQYPQSIRELKKALELNPSLIDCHSKIESAYRKIGLAHSAGPG